MKSPLTRFFGKRGGPAPVTAPPVARASQSTDAYETIEFRPLAGGLPRRGTIGWRSGPDTRVTLNVWDGPDASAGGIDLFEAFRVARLALEKDGFIPMVEGARSDSFPSGMARNMGEGEMTYRLIEGKSPDIADLRFLFDTADADDVATVAVQERAVALWRAGIPEEDAE